VNDVKTTSKTVADFHETVEYYSYDIQASLYLQLILCKFPELSDYEVRFTFIVIDKYKQIYPFGVKAETIKIWTTKLSNAMDMFQWHYKSKNYGQYLKTEYHLSLKSIKSNKISRPVSGVRPLNLS